MAVNWSSIYGIGKGDAQVWQGNKGLEYLEQQNYAEQKRKQKEDAELTAELASVNYDGAKQEDIPQLIEGYNDIKKTFAQYRQAKNSQDRIQLANEIGSKKNRFTQMLSLSKQNVQMDAEYGKIPLTRPNEVSDDYHDRYKKFKSLSSFDPERATLGEDLVKNAFRPKFDELGFIKKIAPFAADKVSTGITSQRVGNATVYSKKEGEKFNPQKLENIIIGEAKTNRDLVRHIQSRYPNVSIGEGIKAYVAEKSDELSSMYEMKDRTIRTQEDETMSEYQRRMLALNEAKANSSGNASTVAIAPKVFMTSEFDVNTGKTTSREGARFEKFGTVNPVAFDTPQLRSVYDVKSGKNIPHKAFKNASVTGVGYALVKGNKYEKKASVIDADGKEFIVNYNELPLKAKEDKFLKAVVGRLGEAPKAKPQAGSIPIVDSDEAYKAIPKGAKYKAPDGTIYVKK